MVPVRKDSLSKWWSWFCLRCETTYDFGDVLIWCLRFVVDVPANFYCVWELVGVGLQSFWWQVLVIIVWCLNDFHNVFQVVVTCSNRVKPELRERWNWVGNYLIASALLFLFFCHDWLQLHVSTLGWVTCFPVPQNPFLALIEIRLYLCLLKMILTVAPLGKLLSNRLQMDTRYESIHIWVFCFFNVVGFRRCIQFYTFNFFRNYWR